MSRAINKIKTQEGFTLIELMVVLVILGILAVISVPVYSNYVRRAKISEAISNVQAFATAARIYRMETGNWPTRELLSPTTTTTTSNNSKVVDVDETYFEIRLVPTTTTLSITATNKAFDVPGNFRYDLDTNYKGVWVDGAGSLLRTYASYLITQ
jgi:type II secretion system protein G